MSPTLHDLLQYGLFGILILIPCIRIGGLIRAWERQDPFWKSKAVVTTLCCVISLALLCTHEPQAAAAVQRVSPWSLTALIGVFFEVLLFLY